MYVYPVHVYAKFKRVKLGKKFLFRTLVSSKIDAWPISFSVPQFQSCVVYVNFFVYNWTFVACMN